MIAFLLSSNILFEIARAGGGGSGGSGGTGGGGSGGSGGGIGALILIAGFIIGFIVAKTIQKIFPRKTEKLIAGLVFISTSLVGIWIASSSFFFEFLMLVFLVGLWMGWGAIFSKAVEKARQAAEKTKQTLSRAAKIDKNWEYTTLVDLTNKTFMAYQADWSNSNKESIKTYTTTEYAEHAGLMLRLLDELGRQNQIKNPKIIRQKIIRANDDTDNSKDSFTVDIYASAEDKLINRSSGDILYADNNMFHEYWTFVRQANQWLLSGISQATARLNSRNSSLKELAKANQMHYSLDMGWLFLPANGVLFKGGRFGRSDINNHVIGLHNNHLIQLYTYSDPTTFNALIAQITLPKSYGGILVRRRGGLLADLKTPKPPKNYAEYHLEWPDFEKLYRTYATDADRLATFELLNPKFMAYLYDTDPRVSIEVADNTVYLYKQISSGSKYSVKPDEYKILLNILNMALKELKL